MIWPLFTRVTADTDDTVRWEGEVTHWTSEGHLSGPHLSIPQFDHSWFLRGEDTEVVTQHVDTRHTTLVLLDNNTHPLVALV